MTEFESAFSARLLELWPELIPVRNAYIIRAGVECEFHYDLTINDGFSLNSVTIIIEFWSDGTIWYSLEDDSGRNMTSWPRRVLADPEFKVEQVVEDLRGAASELLVMPCPVYFTPADDLPQ